MLLLFPLSLGACRATVEAEKESAVDSAYSCEDTCCDWTDFDGYCADDCNDADAQVNPGAEEVCDGIDNDCDGATDDCVRAWHADSDGDGYGDATVVNEECCQPEGYVWNDGDCDDADAAINPDGTDLAADGIDQDCDGVDAT